MEDLTNLRSDKHAPEHFQINMRQWDYYMMMQKLKNDALWCKIAKNLAICFIYEANINLWCDLTTLVYRFFPGNKTRETEYAQQSMWTLSWLHFGPMRGGVHCRPGWLSAALEEVYICWNTPFDNWTLLTQYSYEKARVLSDMTRDELLDTSKCLLPCYFIEYKVSHVNTSSTGCSQKGGMQ